MTESADPIVQVVVTKNSRGQYKVTLFSATKTIDSFNFISPEDAIKYAAEHIPELAPTFAPLA